MYKVSPLKTRKLFLREIKEGLNTWRYHVHGWEDSIIKMTVLSSAIPSRIPLDSFVEIYLFILIFI